METLLSQAEQLPGLLAASRSGLVRSWDPATLKRSLSWGRFFQQLHSRLRHAQPGLRAALERRLSRAGLPLGLGHLRRCPELLAAALLENRALPCAARHRLLRGLFFPAAEGEEPFVHLLARRKAASQLLLVRLPPAAEASAAGGQGGPAVKAQAQLLLSRLREGGPAASSASSSGVALLEQLPRGATLYRAVAAALLEPGGEVEARTALLPWLLQGGEARLATFCRLLPPACAASLCSRHPPLRAPYWGLLASWGSRLAYDSLHGEWTSGALEKDGDEVPWREVAERVRLLSREPEPLGGLVLSQLRRLKAQDGDFEVRGLSVWTDLLLDMEIPELGKKPGRAVSPSITTAAQHLETWKAAGL